MTKDLRWKIAKWIKRNGETSRASAPKWFPDDMTADGKYVFFSVGQFSQDIDGCLIVSDDDIFHMTDENRDAYQDENVRRIHELRDWIEPVGVVIATAISIVALIVSIVALQQPPL